MTPDFTFTVDEEFNRKHNEYFRDSRRLQVSALVFAVVLIGIGLAVLFYSKTAPWGWMAFLAFAVLAVVCVVIAAVVPKKIGTPQEIYDRYPLVPAVIAEINARDLVLLALVDTSAEGGQPGRWGLAARTVTRLEGHAKQIGERVPSVAIGGRRSVKHSEQWDQITPMPIAWGTSDQKVIKGAERSISERRWKKLAGYINKLPEVRETKFDLLVLNDK